MDKTKKALIDFILTANALAESVKRNIAHESTIDDETVLKLNKFTIASNNTQDILGALGTEDNEKNTKLN